MAVAIPYIAIALAAGSEITKAESDSAQASNEASIAKQNADAVAAQAGQAEDAQRRQRRELLAKQSAAIGEANLTPGPTTDLLQEQTSIASELDALNIRYEGMVSRTNWLNEAANAKARGKSARLSGYMAAGASILTGMAAMKADAMSPMSAPKPAGTMRAPIGATSMNPYGGFSGRTRY